MSQAISPKDAQRDLATGKAILIDVREADEFKDQHIGYAQSLPLSNFEENFKNIECPEGQKIIFHCKSGSRSAEAAEKVKSHANDIYSMDGGIEAWISDELPTIGASAKIPVMRQVQMIVGSTVAIMIALSYTGIVWPLWIAGFFGIALFFAGLTGWCGMAKLLKQMPWNN